MSVTFTSDLPDKGLPTREPCLCTQMHVKFSQWVQYGAGEAREMERAADSECHVCKGTGVELTTLTTTPELNLSNVNAEALLAAMGIEAQGSYGLVGEMSIAQARRGVIRARNRRSLEPFVPRADWTSAFGARVIAPVHTTEHVEEHVDRFSKFVELSAELGAKKIRWF